jgi:type IV secretory pathway component VirB8
VGFGKRKLKQTIWILVIAALAIALILTLMIYPILNSQQLAQFYIEIIKVPINLRS